MNIKRFLTPIFALSALVLVAACGDDDDSSIADTGEARIRVIHASHDGPAVNVWVDGQQAISGLGFGKSSGFLSVMAGTRAVKVNVAQSGATLIDTKLDLSDGQDYTVFAVNKAASIEAVVSSDERAPASGKAKVRFVHASSDAPAVDIRVGSASGTAVFSNAAFKSRSSYVTVDSGAYSFVVTPAGKEQAVVSFDPATLEAGKVYTVMAIGTLEAKDSHPFVVRVFVDNADGMTSVDLKPKATTPPAKKAMVLVTHASPDAPGVDLLVDDTKVNSAALLFAQNTGYLSLDAGKRNVKVNVTGTKTTVIEADLTLEAGKAYSVFAVGKVANIGAVVLSDDLSAPAKGKAHVRFVHLSPDAPAVDIVAKGVGTVFSGKAFKEATSFTPVAAGTLTLEVKVASTGATALTVPNVTLEDGKIYTIYAKGLLADSSLSAQIIVNKAAGM